MILDKIVEDKKIRLAEHRSKLSFESVRREAEYMQKNINGRSGIFYRALSKGRNAAGPVRGISIIGEFKKASPSLGDIKQNMELTDRIDEYNESVDAISCLTEEDHFKGNTDYLKQIRSISELPILRKDFMIDEYQFYEAKMIGADAVLLITAILDDTMMRDFYQLSKELDLDVLVETHDEYEIERAMKIDPEIIGVNNRNLNDFSIDLKNTGKLRKYIPEEKVFVSESGIMNDEDIKYLKELKVDAFLIGRAFMESKNPKELATRWKSI
jgi:indole-3-glycerol phosphate synthase